MRRGRDGDAANGVARRLGLPRATVWALHALGLALALVKATLLWTVCLAWLAVGTVVFGGVRELPELPEPPELPEWVPSAPASSPAHRDHDDDHDRHRHRRHRH